MTAGQEQVTKLKSVAASVAGLAAQWRPERDARSVRTALDPADLRALAEVGYTLTGVPSTQGGLWSDLPGCARAYVGMTEALARVDPSLALVTAMHPLVLAYWLGCAPQAAERQAFEAQAQRFFTSARAGAFWGTITSEPGSGGDIFRTRSITTRDDSGQHRLTGEKHFGSGSGACSYMVTTAKVSADAEPSVFVLDMTGVDPLTSPDGITLRRAWDGIGMMSTQSHALRFDDFPVEPHAAPAASMGTRALVSQLSALLFASVALAILEEAMAAARTIVAGRVDGMRPLERVTWVAAQNRAWLARQAHEGMLRAVEQGDGVVATLRGKQSIAELAETTLLELGRVIGGASFSRSQPFGQWLQDVRALGFLRPPWGLADDLLFELGTRD